MSNPEINNQQVLRTLRSTGVRISNLTWLAGAQVQDIPQSLQGFFYDTKSQNLSHVAPCLQPARREAPDLETLLYNLDNAGLFGFIACADVRCRTFDEDGTQRLFATTETFWFYAPSTDNLYYQINAWAALRIKKMREHCPLIHATRIAEQVMANV